jgi:hypothetical protein
MPNLTYVPIQTYSLQGTTSVSFTNIPQTYTDLIIQVTIQTTSNSTCFAHFNDDNVNTITYTENVMWGDGSGINSARSQNAGGVNLTSWASYVPTSTTFNVTTSRIFNYSSPNVNKVTLSRSNQTNDVRTAINMWNKTEPITKITVGTAANGNAGSSVTLYGIEAPLIPILTSPKAIGGTVSKSTTHWYHTFRYTSSFTPLTSLTADILVVAGGGGGGWNRGGGGGAGGLLGWNSQSLTAQTYTCTVGSGGVGATATGGRGASGSNSQFGALTASVGGGGGGGGTGSNSGLSGGSGGGAGADTSSSSGNTGGAATSGQGMPGGTYLVATTASGGGGGGSDMNYAAGNATTGAYGGEGGRGVHSYQDWLSTTNTGIDGYIAGGGGGASQGTVQALGGVGGGGLGGNSTANLHKPGAQSTGSGGGGASFNDTKGAEGGSGLIIVRYLI